MVDATMAFAEGAALTTTMPTGKIFADYRDGEEHGWDTEFQWLAEHHADKIASLLADVKEHGIQEPVLLGTDGRVWDGHHRLYVASLLALPMVPVEYA